MLKFNCLRYAGTPLLFLGGDVDGLCQEAVNWGGWSEADK